MIAGAGHSMVAPGLTLALASILGSTGCMVGPKYVPPASPLPVADIFREAEAIGLKPANPSDELPKGEWWTIYKNPALDALERQIVISNQNVLAARAQFMQARAAVLTARSFLYPVGTAGLSIAAARTGGVITASGRTYELYRLPLELTWEPDLWGAFRRGVTAAVALAQATAADLEGVRLLYQSELAQDFFQIHGIDTEIALLKSTEASFQEFVTLTSNRYKAGVASPLDVSQAEAQLYGVQSNLIDLGTQRAQFEHAIAVLTGVPPSDLVIPSEVLDADPPPVPVALPSELLQRRPDIASAERSVAAANEQIGIAIAAFYPSVTLDATFGFENVSLENWFTGPSRFWSVGPSLSQALFVGGRLKAAVAEQIAAYDASVANYRQIVLTAFQQVEDSLANLRILESEAAKVKQTIAAAQEALRVSSIQYKAGATTYLTVLTAQATLLNAQITAVQIQARRLIASVQLVQALGGGWDVTQLPPPAQLKQKLQPAQMKKSP